MYDVIVVGARCAGSPTAMLLARAGYRVLLVDRASFPSDTLSGHYIHQPGVASLARWGLLEQVAGSNCPPIKRALFDLGPFTLTGSPPPLDGIDAAYAPRRTVLDTILVEAAVEAGVELRERFATSELLFDGSRVIGIRGRERVIQPDRVTVGFLRDLPLLGSGALAGFHPHERAHPGGFQAGIQVPPRHRRLAGQRFAADRDRLAVAAVIELPQRRDHRRGTGSQDGHPAFQKIA